MNCLIEKLFDFFSLSKSLKIIIILTLSININCLDQSTPSTYNAKNKSIEISPINPSVALGNDQQFTATLHNSDGSTVDVTSEVTWVTTNTSVAIISSSEGSEGLATAIGLGGTKIIAEIGNISDTTLLTVQTVEWWEVEVTTTAPSQNMTIEMDGPVDLTIDWGDTIEDTTTLTSITHTYASVGVYTLRIRGQASRIRFDNPDAQARLTRILSAVQGISGLTSFDSTFHGCTNLTGEIPAGLFDNCPNVTTFIWVFRDCSGLTGSIPAGLFGKCPNALIFRAAFIRCSGLTGPIPAGLFDNNPLASDFLNTFQSCSGLTAIPDGLFDNTPRAINFMYTFQHCTGLTYVPSDLFDNTPQVVTFQQTFDNCTGITSSVPELWVDTATKFPNLSLPVYAGGCFENVTNAANWSLIPTMWGGPL